MTTIEAEVPDYLAALAVEAAAKEKTTLDHIIARVPTNPPVPGDER